MGAVGVRVGCQENACCAHPTILRKTSITKRMGLRQGSKGVRIKRREIRHLCMSFSLGPAAWVGPGEFDAKKLRLFLFHCSCLAWALLLELPAAAWHSLQPCITCSSLGSTIIALLGPYRLSWPLLPAFVQCMSLPKA